MAITHYLLSSWTKINNVIANEVKQSQASALAKPARWRSRPERARAYASLHYVSLAMTWLGLFMSDYLPITKYKRSVWRSLKNCLDAR
jgi:hypothetical protein